MTDPRKAPPSHRAIASHWIGRTPPGCNSPLPIYDLAELHCFACRWWHIAHPDGCSHGLERAHVIPHASGGNGTDPANFALLCQDCHRAAPDTNDALWFWQWVDQRQARDPLTDEVSRYQDITTTLIGRLTPDALARLLADSSGEEFRTALDVAAKKLRPVVHEGRLASATILRLAIEASDIVTAAR